MLKPGGYPLASAEMQRRSRLPATVVALGVVSLLTDMSSEMIYPLMPAFLVTVLGAGAVALGLVEGVAEATASILKVVSGRRSDRSGRRKPLVVAGYTTSGLARPLIGLATVWPSVVALRFVDRIGKGLRTSPRDALIAGAVSPDQRGRAFGLHRSMDHAGAVLGPLIAAGLLALGFDLRSVFLLAVVPAVLVVLVLVFFVREESTPPPPPEPSTGKESMPRPFKLLLVATVVFTLGNSTDAFFLLRFTDSGMSAGLVAVLWAGHGAVKMAATWMGGRLTDRLGRRPLVASGWVLYAAAYAGFAMVDSLAGLVVIFIAYGVTFGLTEPAERAWVADLAPRARRGAAFGWYHGAVGIAALPASVVFGLVYESYGAPAAFGMGAALAVIAAAFLSAVPAHRAGGVVAE